MRNQSPTDHDPRAKGASLSQPLDVTDAARCHAECATFGLQYSTDEDVELSSLQLIVNDADAAAGSTDDFMTMLTFGDLLEGTTLEIEPGESNGTGTVTVDDRGDTATIMIEAETADGTAIDGTVECHSVFDFGG